MRKLPGVPRALPKKYVLLALFARLSLAFSLLPRKRYTNPTKAPCAAYDWHLVAHTPSLGGAWISSSLVPFLYHIVVSCNLIVGDVLLLAAIFERFRTKCLETYKLDPAFYLSAAQLSFDAALKKTDAHLDLISDPAMFTIIDSGIPGGISMISNRYAHANNPLVAGYDPSKPKSWIKGLDANNLYGWAMSPGFAGLGVRVGPSR